MKYWIIIIAFIIGALIAGPALYFHYFDPAYQGIEFFGSDAEDDYLAQIQEVYDGHWFSGNLYWADQKGAPYPLQFLSPFLVGMFGKILGISAIGVNLLTKFVLPFFLTIVIYLFFEAITKRKDWALVMAVFIMLTQATWAFLNPGSWASILLRGEFPGTDPGFLNYARPINPQVSSFFFFGYLLCLWKFLFEEFSSKKKIFLGIGSGLILGLSFYTYFFSYSFLLAFTGILFLWFLYKKDRKQIKKILIVVGLAVIIGIPYFLSLAEFLQSPLYENLASIQGVLYNRQFIFSRVWWGVFLLLLVFYRRLPDNFRAFVLPLWIAGFFVTNQQLITGRTAPVPSHYHWYFVAPLGGALLIYLFLLNLERLGAAIISKITAVIILLIFIYSGFLFQKDSYSVGRDYWAGLQRYRPALSWFQKNAPAESVVFANEDLADLLSVYTSHNVYFTNKITNYLADPRRLKDSYFIYFFLDGANQNNAREYFYSHRGDIGNHFFGHYYRKTGGCYGCFPDSLLDGLILEYQDFLKKDFASELKKYRLDYVIWNRVQDPSWNMDRFFSKKIYDQDNLVIYSAF
ncbi:MAG: hypothetical protein Q8P76_03475 [bacterium]|nr:hypothetical protein [bacterium]